jgi:hypothetical protein
MLGWHEISRQHAFGSQVRLPPYEPGYIRLIPGASELCQETVDMQNSVNAMAFTELEVPSEYSAMVEAVKSRSSGPIETQHALPKILSRTLRGYLQSSPQQIYQGRRERQL